MNDFLRSYMSCSKLILDRLVETFEQNEIFSKGSNHIHDEIN